MRKTNKQKWEQLQGVVSLLKDSYLKSVYPNQEYPTHFYKATKYDIDQLSIDRISVGCKGEPNCFNGVTKKDLEQLNQFITNFDNIEKKIYFHYKYSIGESSLKYGSAETVDTINDSKVLSFNKEDLIEIQAELNRKYAPKEGYKPCAYCRVQTPEDELVPYTIIFQNSKSDPFSRSGYRKFVDEKTNMYCTSQCGVHDQWAHEG